MARLPLFLALVIAGSLAACGGDPAVPPKESSPSAVAIAPTGSSAPTASPSSAPTSPASSAPAPAATPLPSAFPVPSARPTPTPAAVPWKTFKSKRYGYTIKYPPTWVVTAGSAKSDDAFDGYRYPYVYAARDTVSGSISVSRTVTQDIAYYKSHYKAKVVSNKAIKLRGWSGRIVTYAGKDDGLRVTIKRIIVGKGNAGYFLTLYADVATSTSDSALFKKMYETFRPN